MGCAILAALFFLLSPGEVYCETSTGTISGTLVSHWLEKGYQMVVYVEKADGDPFAQPEKRPAMNQINLVYVPHVLPIVRGWEVEFHSRDKELHNLLARFKEAFFKKASQIFNLAMPPGSKPVIKKFEKEGLVNMLCSIHKEMNAYILVLQNPYFAVADKKGGFRIKGIPPGSYNLKVWGEKLDERKTAKTYPVVVKAGASARVEIAP
ncbi:MAG: hypothetical protein HY402_04905 [Elusimicrobia bacterium]|nr:hypothetical protein [Elusimicrobiota bacterium]